MSQVNCPFCNALNEAPDTGAKVEVTCTSCGESFIAEFDAPQPQPEPRPAIVATGRLPSADDAIGESWRIVRQWAAIIVVVAAVCLYFSVTTNSPVFLWLGILASSVLPVWFMLWVMAYLRAIAKNTSR